MEVISGLLETSPDTDSTSLLVSTAYFWRFQRPITPQALVEDAAAYQAGTLQYPYVREWKQFCAQQKRT